MLCWLVLAALDDKVVVDWHASWRIAMFSSPLAEGLWLGGWFPPRCKLLLFGPLWVSWKSHGFFGCFHDSGCGCWPGMLVCYGYNVTFESWTQKGVVILSSYIKKEVIFWFAHQKLQTFKGTGNDPFIIPWGLRSPVAMTNWPSVKTWRSSWLGQVPKILRRFEINQKTHKVKEEQTSHCVFHLVIWIV